MDKAEMRRMEDDQEGVESDRSKRLTENEVRMSFTCF
jgi:hypothetical protein